MKGPQHYAEAERLLELAPGSGDYEMTVAVAQVHATLALAAATVEANDNGPSIGFTDRPGAALVRYNSTWVGGEDGEEVTRPASPWAHAFEGTL